MGLSDSENSVDHFFQVELKWSGFQVVLWKRNYRKVKIANSGDQNRVGLKNSPYKKSYNRPGKVGILGLLAIRRISKLRIINTLRKTNPDQVHQLFNHLPVPL